MRTLWFVTVGLGVLYMAVWGVTKESRTAKIEPSPVGVTQGTGPALAGIAQGDAISRIDPGATTQVTSILPKRLAGEDLHEVGLTSQEGFMGFQIVLTASLNERPVAKLTYHAAPPTKVIFVKKEAIP